MLDNSIDVLLESLQNITNECNKFICINESTTESMVDDKFGELASSSSQPGVIIYDKKINSYAYPMVYVSENAYPIYTDYSTKFLCVIQDSENK